MNSTTQRAILNSVRAEMGESIEASNDAHFPIEAKVATVANRMPTGEINATMLWSVHGDGVTSITLGESIAKRCDVNDVANVINAAIRAVMTDKVIHMIALTIAGNSKAEPLSVVSESIAQEITNAIITLEGNALQEYADALPKRKSRQHQFLA